MNIRNVILALAVLYSVDTLHAQLDTDKVSSPWLAPVVTDEMTQDPEQNRQWRLGQYKYPSQPKHMWEVGLHAGNFFINGDVDHDLVAGIGTGVHLRKALTYFTSIRFDGFYGKTRGIETQPWQHRNNGGGLVESNNTFNGWDIYNGSNPDAVDWFPSYETTYYYGAVQLIFNIGNVLFHKERNKWNTYVGIGIGVDHHDTNLDLQDENNEAYTNLRERTGFTRQIFNTNSGRSDISEAIDEIYDGTFETEGFQKVGIFRIGDDFNIHGIFTGSVGVSRKLSQRFNVGIEHQVIASGNDYLDGIKFRSATDQSNHVDIAHYTNFRLGYNLGSLDKRVEPLYWINPMDNVFNEIAEVKSRPQFEWEDEDNDGVHDIVDQELDTPEGCLVDTKGVTLDSDGDGVVDCKDKEPFSPPGFPVDEEGVAQVDDIDLLTEEDVITIIKENCEACANQGYAYVPPGSVVVGPDGRVISSTRTNTDPNSAGSTTGSGSTSGSSTSGSSTSGSSTSGGSGSTGNSGGTGNTGGTGTIGGGSSGGVGTVYNAGGYGSIIRTGCGNWFLPMINFDLDKYGLRPEAFVALHQIASVMRKCPEINVTAHGHTDVRNSNSYNRVLSYKRAKEAIDYMVSAYGIDRNRFKLMFGGEESPLIGNLKNNHYTTDLEEQMQFINRRVEFRVSEDTDINMGRPEGPDAGKDTYGSSRPGSKYRGYKTSGY